MSATVMSDAVESHARRACSFAELEALCRQQADWLVKTNVRLADCVAYPYVGRGVPSAELKRVAHAALLRAASEFVGTEDGDFMAYASPLIKAEVRGCFALATGLQAAQVRAPGPNAHRRLVSS